MTTPDSKPEPDAGEWIEWRSGDCPVAPEALVEIKLRGGDRSTPSAAREFDWRHLEDDQGQDIIAYRIASVASLRRADGSE